MRSSERKLTMRLTYVYHFTLALSLLSIAAVRAQKPDPVLRPGQTPIQIPGKLSRPPRINLSPAPLWGFADLHTHPATHMSFGADANGNGGIFWGKPGLGLASAAGTIAADLPPCASDSHYGFDGDLVRKMTRRAVIEMIDGLTGFTHNSSGFPAFSNWPNAQSLTHQQMHITSIKRAYDGGLRLMCADVTDSQMLSNLWTKIGANLFGNAVPPPDPNAEMASARRQLDFIQRQVAANSSWMRIVKSAAEARQTIAENKLAVILGVEMDSLTADQILELSRTHGVRHVIPIHLTNNSIGGTAVYSDAFNASNNYLNGSFFKIRPDPLLEFQLGRPSVLRSAELGAIKPVEVDTTTYLGLGYLTPGLGHKNSVGVNTAAIQRLMKAGLLIDVAHMGELSTEQTLGLAERFGYPVMDSHTGLRGPNEKAHSERDLKRSHAQRLTKLGGVIGYGTEGSASDRELLNLDPSQKPLIRFTGSDHELTRSLPTAGPSAGKLLYNLRLTIATGGDDLRGGNDNADVKLGFRNGSSKLYPNINQGQGWGGGARKTVTLPLPPGTKSGDIISFSLITHFGGGLFGDNWNVDSLRLVGTEQALDTVGQWASDYKEAQGIIGGQPLALGTDMNGFAPQVPFAAEPTSYPLTIASRTGTPPSGYRPPALARSTLGARTFGFQQDGIAHYGMLADFMQAISQKPASQPVLDSLYRSADAVVKMWELCGSASSRM